MAVKIMNLVSDTVSREVCEGCGEWAEQWDCEGTPLCEECWSELVEFTRMESIKKESSELPF